MTLLDHARQDLRDAVRSITRYPVAAIVATLSLAAGVGATSTTLTVRDIIFKNPPPTYTEPEQLSRIQVGRPNRPIMPVGSYVPGPLYTRWADALGPSVAAATPLRGSNEVTFVDRKESVSVREVTPGFFSVLGVQPALGTVALPANVPAAVLSYKVWVRIFEGRADALGSQIWINGRAYTLVGVLPPQFWFSRMESSVWTSLDPAGARSEESLEVVVRRPPTVTPDMLIGSLQAALVDYANQLPAAERQLRLKASEFAGTPMADDMSLAIPWVLGMSVALTLLIACANAAILLIAQWTAREHEIAIRASLGAGRGRLVRSLLMESTVLAACGGALGFCVTLALRGILIYRTGALPFFDLAIKPHVWVESFIITIAAGILVGLAPAIWETRRLHGNPWRVNATTEQIRQRWRHALVVAEISVTVALLVVTVALTSGALRTFSGDMGFSTRPMMSVRLENKQGVPIAKVLDALAEMPEVAQAAVSTSVPFAGSGPRQHVSTDATGALTVVAERAAITPSFFATLGVPLLAGRGFTTADSAATRTAIVNEALARRLFAGRDATGARVFLEGTPYDVVGVSANFENSPFFREHEPRIFLPMAITPAPARVLFVVRAKDDPTAIVRPVRLRMTDAAGGNTTSAVFTFDQIRTIGGQEMLVGTVPLAPLVVIGVLLTVAGIYGVLAFAIARRSRELAVRMAIGATGRDLSRLVAGHTARLFVAGTALGIGLSYALARIVRASGGAGSVYDARWPAFVIPIVIIAIVATLATWVPSRRVRRIDPAVLLRAT